MKLEPPKNPNYCAVVVEITNTVDLPNCDNVKGAIIYGNHVIVGKDTPHGLKGIYFPAETQLSEEFLSHNNLYRDSERNKDTTKAGYFETNRRIRTMKFRGHKSEGFFCPIEYLSYILTKKELDELAVGDTFDHICNKQICKKYAIDIPVQNGPKVPRRTKKLAKFDRLVPGQFNLHIDTLNARLNIRKLSPEDTISISRKLHGTSWIVGKVNTRKKLPWYLNLLKKFLPINENEYSALYSSRNIIKNKYVNPDAAGGYYNYDLWKDISSRVENVIPKGITLYGEAVGQLPSGKWIQPGYDYGTRPKEFELYVYRITFTNIDGKVFEFSWPQIQEFCNTVGLKMVPTLYYGKAKDYAPQIPTETHWHENFLGKLEKDFMLDRDCPLCSTGVPEEGVVIRPEKLYSCEPLKLKNFRFLGKETELLDKGFLDMESEQSTEQPEDA